jgi:hypothetical protein
MVTQFNAEKMMKTLFLVFSLIMTNSYLYASFKESDAKISLINSELTLARKSNSSAQRKFSLLQSMSEEIRQIAPSFHGSVIEDIKAGKPLHGSQLTLIHKIVGTFVALDYQLNKIEKSSSSIPLKLMSKLERYKSFSIIYLPFYSNKKFRRLVNAEDRSYDVERKELKKIVRELIKKSEIKKVNQEIEQFKRDVKNNIISRDERYVHDVIEHSIIDSIQNKRIWKKLRRKTISQTLSDFGSNSADAVVHVLSGAFGNSAGSIRWRKGHLLKNKEITEEIRNELKPLDIITEKIRFALTDTFIPGHFGHNAIWLGTPSQLKDLGIWNHPIIKPFHSELMAGKSIIETDRSGTHFKSLDVFMNVDEFGLLRLKPEILDIERDKSKVLEIYKVALAQLGKTYDFNFDVETTDQLVCSELLYQAFGDVNWPTEDYIGRTTISPDNVVSLAVYNNAPIDLIYYVQGKKDGVVVRKDIDDLAKDIGFKKFDGGEYRQSYEVCKSVEVKRPGSRGREVMRKRECETKYERKTYVHHRSLPSLTSSF